MRAALRLLFIYIGLAVANTTQDHPTDPPATTTPTPIEDTNITPGTKGTDDIKVRWNGLSMSDYVLDAKFESTARGDGNGVEWGEMTRRSNYRRER